MMQQGTWFIVETRIPSERREIRGARKKRATSSGRSEKFLNYKQRHGLPSRRRRRRRRRRVCTGITVYN